MIRLIAFNKFFLIILLGGLLTALAFYYYAVSIPKIESDKKALRKNSAEISELSQNLEELKAGIAQFLKQEEEFKQLEKKGFFDPQDRVQARKKLNYIRDMSGVITAQYTIKPAGDQVNEQVKAAGHKILDTPMEFSLDAIEDADIYRFIYYLNYGFPGQITIKDITMTRNEDITIPKLKQIGLGLEPMTPFISAKITANWRTIVPDATIAVTGGSE